MRNEGTRIEEIAANLQMWSNGLRDHMLVCPGCAWSSRIAHFQHRPWPEENIRPSVCHKTKLRARARLSGADAGDDRQILRYKLCNFVGIEIFAC
jgi:hypothetical protein